MKVIEVYSFSHFSIVFFAVILAVAGAKLLKNANKTRLLFSCGIILLLMEILKQLLLTYVNGWYSWSDFPFQLCSIPMYLCLLYPLLGKYQAPARCFILNYGFLGALAAFLVPEGNFYPYLLLTAHSAIWHGILLFLALYIKNSAEELSIADFKKSQLLHLFLSLCAVAINAALFRISNEASNMFFLGPARPWVPVLDQIYFSLGWICETAFMIAVSQFAAAIVFKFSKRK